MKASLLQIHKKNSDKSFSAEQVEVFAERYDLVHQTFIEAYPVGHLTMLEGSFECTK